MSDPKLDPSDFAFDDVIPLRPALTRRMNGDIEGAAVVARIQYRCRAQRPYSDGLHWWETSAQELASDLGVSVDRAKRKLRALVADEWLITRENPDPWNRTLWYRPNDGAELRVSAGQPEGANLPPRRGGSAPSTGQNCSLDGADLLPLLSTKEVLKKEQEKTSAPAELDLFDEFWKVYPAKKGKIAAKRAWAKAIKIAPAEQIISGAMVYRTDSRVLAGFTKDPATWLNGGHWDDELTLVGAGARGGHRAYQDPADQSVYLEEL